VFIPDAPNDPMLQNARAALDVRNVRSIVVVPIRWRSSVIGAIFLRTERESEPFTESDVGSAGDRVAHGQGACNEHRFESLLRRR
jgi:GAF domain-containing protein